MVLGLPGHTLGHIGYVGDGKLFCGDVLFLQAAGEYLRHDGADVFFLE